DTVPTTFRAAHGWLTTLPVGIDALELSRTFDTDALAACFPFATTDLPSTSGVLLGVHPTSQALVWWDRFSQDNHNTVILARSGAGKSYLAKLELLRWLYTGVHSTVIDPENEYVPLAHAVDGAVIALGQPGVRINPFDLGDEPDT